MNFLTRFWPTQIAVGVAYVASLVLARALTQYLEKLEQQKPKKGRIVEFPDELGLWWVEEEE